MSMSISFIEGIWIFKFRNIIKINQNCTEASSSILKISWLSLSSLRSRRTLIINNYQIISNNLFFCRNLIIFRSISQNLPFYYFVKNFICRKQYIFIWKSCSLQIWKIEIRSQQRIKRNLNILCFLIFRILIQIYRFKS